MSRTADTDNTTIKRKMIENSVLAEARAENESRTTLGPPMGRFATGRCKQLILVMKPCTGVQPADSEFNPAAAYHDRCPFLAGGLPGESDRLDLRSGMAICALVHCNERWRALEDSLPSRR